MLEACLVPLEIDCNLEESFSQFAHSSPFGMDNTTKHLAATLANVQVETMPRTLADILSR